jgi:DNA topoisomerase VI subunit B
VEINRYKTELQKLKNFLMDKIDQYPEIAKEIEKDINIVSREINTVNRISRDEKQISKRKNSEVQLNVNDKDLYEDANRNRDEQKEELQEREKPRGFRR